MRNRFITFTGAEGIYRKAIRPYKKWQELTDMSPWIEADGGYYRILRTTGISNRFKTRKLVICNEDGELIRDEDLTRFCLETMGYLDYFNRHNLSNILAWGQDDITEKFNLFIRELNQLINTTGEKVTKNELRVMKSQLYYYEEMKRYSSLVVQEADELKTYIPEFKQKQIDILLDSFTKKLEYHITHMEIYKNLSRAKMIENGLKTRDEIRKILKNKKYQRYFSNVKCVEQMIKETDIAEKTVTQLIANGKRNWKREVKWLDPKKGKFTVARYVDELWSQNTVDTHIKVIENRLLNDHWLFSKKRKH